MAWRRSDAPRDGAHSDDPDPTTHADETTLDERRHASRAPAYWDDSDDVGGTTVPSSDVLSTSIWEARPRQEPRVRVPAPRAEEPETPNEGAGVLPAGAPPEDDLGEPPARRLPAVVDRTERWFRARQAQLVWVAALVVGVLLGGAVVHSWEAQQAAAARRDNVHLAARVAEDAASSASWTGARQPWTLRVVLSNIGSADVRIGSARLDDKRFRSTLRSVSRGARVPSGDDTWISLDVTHSCSIGGPASAPSHLILRVTPTGRPEREVRVRLTDDTTLIVDTARQKCQSSVSDIWITSELTGEPAELDKVLVTPIRIRQVGTRVLALRDIRTPTPGLSMVTSGRPISFAEDVTPVTPLRWSIADCARARIVVYAEVGVSAVVQLTEAGPAIRTPIVLDANAVLAIVRFITRSCG